MKTVPTKPGLPIYLSACLSVCLPAYLSIYLSVCLSVCLPAYLSIYLSVCLSVCLPACLFIYLSDAAGEAARRPLKTHLVEAGVSFGKFNTCPYALSLICFLNEMYPPRSVDRCFLCKHYNSRNEFWIVAFASNC